MKIVKEIRVFINERQYGITSDLFVAFSDSKCANGTFASCRLINRRFLKTKDTSSDIQLTNKNIKLNNYGNN